MRIFCESEGVYLTSVAPPQRRWEDPIVKETREAREELFARFNHDLAALCRFLREKEREHSDRVVTLEPRRPEPEELAIK